MRPLDNEDAILEKLREKLGPAKKVDERAELERLFGKKEESEEDRLRKKMVRPVVSIGDVVDIHIDKLAFGGDGLGKHGNFPVFVSGTVPGDAVKVRITQVNKDRCHGELLETIAPSANRVKPECPLFGKCGGCQLQTLVYTAQLKTKAVMVHDVLQRIGKIDSSVRSVIRSPEAYGYRIRTRLHTEIKDNTLQIGFYASKKRYLIPITSCPLLAQSLNRVLEMLPELLPAPGTASIPSEILLQTNTEATSVLIHLVSKEPIYYCAELLSRCQKNNLPVVGVTASGGSEFSEAGSIQLSEKIHDTELFSTGRSFIQANRYLYRKLIDQTIMLSSPAADDTILDLYCGNGFFSLPLARFVQSVTGMEGNPGAIENAVQAADKAGLKNTNFITSDDACFFKKLQSKYFSLVIVDPPRNGLHPNVLKEIIKMKPAKLLYISCDPSTLARDLKSLVEADFRVRVIQPIDLFPQTYHLENLVFLTHRYTGTQAANQAFQNLN